MKKHHSGQILQSIDKNTAMKHAPLQQLTTEAEVQTFLQGKSPSYASLYIGSSDPLQSLLGATKQGEAVTTIAGGCEYPLSFLLNEPSALHLCDLSPIATAAAEIKLQCLRLLDTQDFLETVTPEESTPLSNTSLLQRHVLPQLSAAGRTVAELLSSAAAFEEFTQQGRLEKRGGFTLNKQQIASKPGYYEHLQRLARAVPITLRSAHVRRLEPQLHTLYISNVGILHGHTCSTAARLVEGGWQRVLYSAYQYSRDDYDTREFTFKHATGWEKNPASRTWGFQEWYHHCAFRILGCQEETEFPLLIECTKTTERAKLPK